MTTNLPTEAAERFAFSVDHHRPEYARSRAISRTKLATLVMRQGNPCEAAAIGEQALADAGAIRSRRTTDGLRALHQAAGPHAGIAQVQALRQRITDAVGAAA